MNMDKIDIPLLKLNNGLEMPSFGLGTYLAEEGECEEAIKYAIDLGYRHFDTAYFYHNEKEVGAGVRAKILEKKITRSDVYIVTKLWHSFHSPELVEKACRLSYENLNLGPIDLYLMHAPMGYEFQGWEKSDLTPKGADGNLIYSDVDYIDTWHAMEKLVEKGLVKSIGVSNFNSEQITRLLSVAKIKPVTNQVECSPNINQRELIDFCNAQNILITAYGPLGRPHRAGSDPKLPQPALNNKIVLDIAAKYNKTPAQVILRYLIEIGCVPIPKSSNKNRMAENLNIFDFKLSQDEITLIDGLNTHSRMVPLTGCEKHKYYPFNIKF